ncbi:hypothetical protein [Streptomyces gobiensis]|uniref:hypothetical protein n=1 Tax=Streptomyces gobiensis TaxID=2875706 RepID=UPI001E6509BF|nr:hypothetical protein [Streptomyces gobiensis]UGY94298.1 hypothetical protein test1122_22910 [Streptomyces gobiensis]
MTENVPVRCPVCRREHAYAPPTYPCPCGAPVTPPLLHDGVPVRIQHRTWADSWVAVRCGTCGRREEWPHPELGCGCGALLRLPVDGAAADAAVPQPSVPPVDATDCPQPAVPNRPAFRPVTIRTARDAVLAAGQYLRWLGFAEVRAVETRTASGVDLRGPGVVAQVDPTTSPTTLRGIETLWLNGLHESAVAVCFSLAGFARDARSRADELGLPLFVLDLTGTPQPVNDAADQLIRTGA